MTNSDDFFDSAEDVFGFDSDDGYQTDADDAAENDAEESETTEEVTEESADEPQDEPESAETAGEVTEEEAEEDGAEGNDGGDSGNSEQKFTIKVNKQDMELTTPQMIEYAQKGVDYDRVKGQLETERQSKQELQAKLDEQQEYMEVLALISEKTKLTVADLLEQLHVNAVKKEGQTEAEVRAQIKAEKLERQLNARNEQQTKQKEAEDENVNRIQRDIAEFRQQFPDVQLTEELAEKLKPDIQAGMSMTSAYLKQENARKDAEIAQLQKQQAADAQNKKNRTKAPGSMRDSGGGRTIDLAGVFERELFK